MFAVSCLQSARVPIRNDTPTLSRGRGQQNEAQRGSSHARAARRGPGKEWQSPTGQRLVMPPSTSTVRSLNLRLVAMDDWIWGFSPEEGTEYS